MEFVRRIGDGLRLIKETFIFLWHNKLLVAYPAAAMAGFALIQLALSIAFGMRSFGFLPDQKFVAYLIGSSNYLVLLLLVFLQSFIVTYFSVRLAHHAFRLMHAQKDSVMHEMSFFSFQIVNTALWSVILVIFTLAQYGQEVRYQTLLQTNPSQASTFGFLRLLLLVWVLFTCYMIPIIATEKMNIIAAIKHAMRLVGKTWLEIMAGFSVLLFLGILVVVPALYVGLSGLTVGTATLLNLLIFWPLQCIGSALSTLFTAIAYHYFYKQPQEEVDMLRYPEF